MTGNLLAGNIAHGDGGGISIHNSAPLNIRMCVIARNSAAERGGGISSWSSQARIFACTFNMNNASSGGAVYSDINSSSEMTNSIFWADSAGSEANELDLDGEINLIAYCDIQL